MCVLCENKIYTKDKLDYWLEESSELERLESNFLSNTFRFCNTCFKIIDKTEPYIVAYKNKIPAYFCRNHIHDAEHYLDWFQEFVEIK